MKKLFLVDKLSFVNRESRRDWVDLILTYDFQRAIESAERNFGDFTCTESRAFQDDISSAHLNTFYPGPTWFLSENELLTIREATFIHSVSIPCRFLALDKHKKGELQDRRH